MSDLEKFENVPVEDDTKILNSIIASVGDIQVLYQLWNWEGVTGESIIFVNEDVDQYTDDEIVKMVKDLPLFNNDLTSNQVTISHSDKGYVFTNFNFIT